MNALNKTKEELKKEIQELRKEFDALQKSLENTPKLSFESIFRNHSAIMFLLDGETGMFVDVNLAAEKFYGYTLEQFRKMKICDVNKLPPDELREERNRALQENRNFFTVHHLLANGEIRTVEVNTEAVEINDVKYLFSVINDITNRKQSETALRNSEEKFKAVFESAKDGILLLTNEGSIVALNEAFARMHGYTVDEMINMNLKDLDTPETSGLSPARMQRVMNGESMTFEVEHFCKSGQTISIEVSASFVTIGGKKYILGFHRAITERKQAQEALKESEQRYHSLFDQANEGLILLTKDGKLVDVNKSFAEMHGYTVDELKNIDIGDLDVHRERSIEDRANIHSRIDQGEVVRFEVEHYHKDGHIITFSDTVSSIKVGDQKCYLAFHQDITKEKRLTNALRESESKYRLMFENMEEGFSLHEIITDDNGHPIDFRFLDANAAYERHTGIKPSDCIGKTIKEIMPNADPIQIENYGKVALTGESMVFEYTSKTFNRHLRVRAYCPQPRRFATIFEDITERKEIENKLKESEERLRLFFENSGDGIFISESKGKIISANPEVCRIFERSEKEICFLVGRGDLFDITDPRYQTAINQRRLTGKIMTELNGLRKDGTVFPCEISSSLFQDSSGANKSSTIIRDISERKRAEEALRESQTNLDAVFNATDESIYLLSADTNLLALNEVAAQRLGSSREKIIGTKIGDLFPSDIKARRQPFIDLALSNGKNVIFEDERNGRWMVNRLNPILNEDGKVVRLAIYSRDNTYRKKIEESLRLSEEKYRTLIENMGEGIGFTNEEEIFVFANPAGEKIFGVGEGELPGLCLNDFLLGENIEIIKNETQKRRKGKGSVYELEIVLKDGSRKNILVTATPSFDDRKFIGTFGIFRDITERKRTEEENKRIKESLEMLNHRLQEIGEEERTLIAREIHDQLGQTLTALKLDMNSLCVKIAKDSEEGTKLKRMIELIANSIKDVQRISSELRPAMLDDLGLSATIEWYIEEFEKRTGINCLVTLDEVQFPDEKKNLILYRILQEATTNVIRHSKAKNVNINLYQAEDSIILEVFDDGIGVEKNKINSNKSLGFIGMRERIKHYNGRMDISSTLNKGTKVIVRLPFN